MKSKPHGKYDSEIATIIEEKLNATWSPEQIGNTVMKDTIGFKTIDT